MINLNPTSWFSRKIQKLKINDFVSVENEDTSSEQKRYRMGIH